MFTKKVLEFRDIKIGQVFWSTKDHTPSLTMKKITYKNFIFTQSRNPNKHPNGKPANFNDVFWV